MSTSPQSASFSAERNRMVESQLRQRGITDQRVLDTMAGVPRHQFVPGRYQAQAYEDHPIPIGFGQTISQPFIVALMLQALAVRPSDTVFEVGTGSGYQTALLAELAARVYSIERHAPLAESAARILRSLGYSNATVLVGDGSKGLPEYAPYDAIIVSAAAPQIPAALFQQLAESGRLIVPIGPPDAQELQLVRKLDGRPIVSYLEGCRFVPLIEGEGYSADE